jgi:hypothetical protein
VCTLSLQSADVRSLSARRRRALSVPCFHRRSFSRRRCARAAGLVASPPRPLLKLTHALLQVFNVEKLDAPSGDAMLHIKVRLLAFFQPRNSPKEEADADSVHARHCPAGCVSSSTDWGQCGAAPASLAQTEVWRIPSVYVPSLTAKLLHVLTRPTNTVFTNMLKDSLLHELADADDGEIIKQVQVNPKVRCRRGQRMHAHHFRCRRNITRTIGRWTGTLCLWSSSKMQPA